jgi:hypothetical protein
VAPHEPEIIVLRDPVVSTGLPADHTAIWRWVERLLARTEQEMPMRIETHQWLLEDSASHFVRIALSHGKPYESSAQLQKRAKRP